MEMGGKATNAMPIISKLFCSSSQVVLVVRRRPRVINGGGFVVTDSSQTVVFKVDGCGVLGTKGELIVRDGDGGALLLIRRKGGVVQALSIHGQWKGYSFDYEGLQKLGTQNWDFEINGYFPDRDCSIVDSKGNIVAQVGVKKEVDEFMGSKDLYHVVIKPGIDQAFVFGVIAVLDYIYGESTRC
ncbi:Protein LURP-one-related 6 [Vitis vinifera]|uniref:Protein LURP-one-related 6 n=1 Tax=Vitis vinifera TaxID=29760 RepID=A0A438E8E2_VITVI|nr:Protein LURP-one-related 6 [Vitis vinifera]